MEAKTRAEGKQYSLAHYFTGKPCKRGHISKRYTGTGICIACCTENNKSWTTKHPSYQQDWIVANRDYVNERNRDYYKNDPEWRKEKSRVYRASNPDKIREYNALWNETNPEKKALAWANWYDNNYEHARVKSKISHDRLKRATPKWVNLVDIYNMYMQCPNGHQVDHIVPLKGITWDGYPVSGLHVPWNLQYLPRKENAAKSNRMRQQDMEIVLS